MNDTHNSVSFLTKRPASATSENNRTQLNLAVSMQWNNSIYRNHTFRAWGRVINKSKHNNVVDCSWVPMDCFLII